MVTVDRITKKSKLIRKAVTYYALAVIITGVVILLIFGFSQYWHQLVPAIPNASRVILAVVTIFANYLLLAVAWKYHATYNAAKKFPNVNRIFTTPNGVAIPYKWPLGATQKCNK
ncbi:MAG: hypothetical protein FWC79_00920 [Oscillospiraceae bacterium]|nr:hypothetical protein [Oscillospiraceae bacterium]